MSEQTFPKSWAPIPIEDCLLAYENGRKIRQGWSPQCESHPAETLDDWGVLKTSAIQDGEYVESANKHIPSKLKPRTQLEVEAGDILITCAGPRSRCGVACLVHKTRPKLLISGKMYQLRVDPEIIDRHVLELFLRESGTKKKIDEMKTGISDSGLNLTHSRFATLEVPLPPLAEQRRIVAKIEELFSELDAGEESLRRARRQLGVYRQSLLKQAFEGKLSAHWRKQNPHLLEDPEQLLERIQAGREVRYEKQLKEWEAADRSGSKLKRPRKPKPTQPLDGDEVAALTLLPKVWIWARVSAVAVVGTGVTPLRSDSLFHDGGDIPWITSTVVNADIVRIPNGFVTKHALEQTNLQVFPAGSLIVALYGEGKTRGKVSQIAFDSTTNQALAVLVQHGREQDIRPYLKLFLLKNYQDVRRLSSGGVQPNLNLGLIERMPFPLCSLPEQHEIVRLLDGQFTVIEQNEREIGAALKRSAALRQSILKKAFTGQLVPQGPHRRTRLRPAGADSQRAGRNREDAEGESYPQANQPQNVMIELTPIDFLRFWIANDGFPDWNLEDGFIRGTYGLIFFLNSKHANSYPSRLALKTLNPESLPEKPTQLDELQREFSKWIRLPSHRNILGANPFKAATLPLPDASDPELTHRIQIPVMPMERMDGTLDDWIASGKFPLNAKLCALAQAFNGLAHLYSNGIQGHGDLKPSNILFRDISTTPFLPGSTWLSDCPWIIKVADLGWADAWVDYGFTSKALREYIAPERLGDSPTVIPEKSDIFSMGIIAAELLLGRHPSYNLKRARDSPDEWRKRAIRGDWNLSGLPSDRLTDFINRCLDPSPDARPTARDAVHLLCQELRELNGVDIEPTLEHWSRENTQDELPFISKRSEEIERLMRTLRLGHEVEANSIRRLRQILVSIKPGGIYSMEDWLQAASGLLDFLAANESPLNQLEASGFRAQARMLVEKTLGQVSQQDFDALAAGIDAKDVVTPFERFGHLLGFLAKIAKVDFEQCLKGEWDLSPLAIAGFALHRASRARSEPSPARSPIEYLDIAIERAPAQAVPYFFRALRKREVIIFKQAGIAQERDVNIKNVIDDLETACRLAPDWKEPLAELENIRKNS